MRKILLLLSFIALVFISRAQVAVTVTNPTNASPALQSSYSSLAAAITDLNLMTSISGPVTITCAAGSETAPAGGYSISFSAATTATNNVIITGTATTTITANGSLTAGNLNDAIFKIIGSDYVTIQNFTMQENAANTTTAAATNNMTEWGVALLYATSTDGAQNCTIKGNTIDLDRTYQNTCGIYSNSTHTATAVTTSATATTTAGGNSGLVIIGNTITDVNLGIIVVGPTAAADNNDGLTIGGTLLNANSITNFGTTTTFSGYANVSATNIGGILVRNTKNFTISYNTITSSNAGVTGTGNIRAIYVPTFSNAPTGTITNVISNNSISLKCGNVANVLMGISNEVTTVNATTTLKIENNDFNNFSYPASGTGAVTFIINAGVSLSQEINNNTFTNISFSTAGNVTFISNSVAAPASGFKTVNGNSIVTGFNKTVAGGTVALYTDGASSVCTTPVQNNNNNFSNITVTGATAITGWFNNDGTGATPQKTMTGNTFSNWTCGTSSVIVFQSNFGGSSTMSNNTISNISGGGAVTGLLRGTSGTVAALNISSNTISGLSTTGASAVIGISTGAAATVCNITKNKLYNFQSNNASAGIVSGVLISAGVTVNCNNNIIGDLRALITSSTTDAIRGINLTSAVSSSNLNVYFNTVYLNATSTGTNFSTSCIFHTTSATATTAALNLRNNILVNLSTAAGSGVTAAYRRSSTTLTNFGSTSNTNLFYAGTPSATSLIFYDGTNSDQTLSAYKTRVSTREVNSISENVPFLSTTGSSSNFLHIDPTVATQIESGGVVISGITDDFDGNTRNVSTPDIGADEGSFTILDVNGPTITFTALSNTGSISNRTTSSFATIIDASSVNTTVGTKPRLYYKTSTNTNAYNDNTNATDGWKYVESSSSASPFDFTIDYSLINGGVTYGTILNYFVVAQDLAGAPNVGINAPNSFAAPPSSVALTGAAFPIGGTLASYSILTPITGTFTVGTGGTYTTLKAFFDFLNSSVVGGNITAQVVGDCSETATAQLNTWTEEPNNSNYTLTIQPSGGASRTISGSFASAAVIKTVGVSRLTIDGLNTGGDALTVSNTNTTAPLAIHIASSGTTTVNNITIQNITTSTGLNTGTTNTSIGIAVSDQTSGGFTSGYFNNISIQNNTLTKSMYGAIVAGGAAAGTNNATNITISSNNLTASGANPIGYCGLAVQGVNGATISQNMIANFEGTGAQDDRGIWVAAGAKNVIVERNSITSLKYTGTSGYGNYGIYLSTGETSSNNIVRNNVIADLSGDGWTHLTVLGDNTHGIYATSTQTGIKIYNNSINLGGNTLTQTDALTTGICLGTGSTADVRNNIIINNSGRAASTGYGSTAIYLQSAASQLENADYNDLFNNATGSGVKLVGKIATTDYASLNTWKVAVSADANSISTDPLYTSTTDLTPTAYGFPGIPIGGITTDYNGTARNTNYPSMGAYEASLMYGSWKLASADAVWETNTNWVGDAGPISTVIIPSGASTMPTLASSPTVNRLFNDGSITIDGVNTLSVSGNISNTGQITGPTAGLTLNGTAAQTVTLGSINIQNFTLNNAAGAALSGSGFLNVTGTVNVTAGVLASAGRLTLKSTATTNARIASVASGAITGNVNVERYFPGKRAFRFLGHPFSASIALSQLMTTNGANTGIDVTGAGGATNGFTATVTNNPSAFNYTPASGNSATNPDPGWNAIGSASATNWAAKQGLRVFVRGTKGEGLNGAAYTPSATTVTMSGTLNDGSSPVFTLSNGASSDYNLIANPLASTIDMQALTLGGDVAGSSFYVWDVSQGAAGAYVNEPFASAATYRYLPLGSAFFARSASGGGTITFPEAAKVSNTPASILRGTSKYGNNSIQLVLNDNAGVKHDRILFFFNKKAVEEKDNMDGEKMTNPGVNFYANSKDSKKLSIDVRPLADNTIIPLTLNTPFDKEFTITAEDFNVTDNKDVLLHDKKTDTYTKLSAGVSYSFTSTLSDATTYGNRFELITKVNPSLLVENILDIKLSPNPVKDVLTINYSTPNATLEATTIIKITNNVGQIIENLNFGASATGSQKINMSKYAKGVYTIELVVGKEKVVKQIVKQ